MAKFEGQHELDPDSICRARLTVAARAHDAEDCRTLLSIPGILPEPDTPADPVASPTPVRCRVRR